MELPSRILGLIPPLAKKQVIIISRDVQPNSAPTKLCHPHGGKLWVTRKERQRPNRPGGGKHRRRNGQIAYPYTCSEDRRLKIISLTTLVAISLRVHRYKLAVRDRQAVLGGGGRHRNIAAANGVGVGH